MILASYLDDCWEPDEAVRILQYLATREGRDITHAHASCLRVPHGDESRAEVLGVEAAVEHTGPGHAHYLWALWSGDAPTEPQLSALYRDFEESR